MRMWPWMARNTPLLCLHFTSDIVTPFFLVGVLSNIVWRGVTQTSEMPIIYGTPFAHAWVQAVLAFLGATISIGVRQIPHLSKHPRDLLLLPVFVIVLTVLMTPIRVWGFMTMGLDASWGTRQGDMRKSAWASRDHLNRN